MITVREALALVSFPPDQLQKIAKLEASIDDSIAREYSSGKMAGAPIKLDINDHVDPKLAYAVARDYEAKGNWRVTILSVAPLSLQLTPIILPEIVTKPIPGDVKTLPPIVRVEAPKHEATKRLLVRMPTRSRPKQALEVLAKYRSMAGIPITIEVIIDEDDETMNAAPVLQRLQALDCVVTIGRHKSKIEACNGGRVRDWDVLLLASDDMVPVKEDYACRVLEAMDQKWPLLDGAIYFDDGFQGKNLCTLPIMGRHFYDLFGYVYHPAYRSLFSDTEQQVLWTQMGRIQYIDEKIIEHKHPAAGKSVKDKLYLQNDALWNADEKIFHERRQQRLANAQWAFGSPPMWLSVCIATIPERRESLTRLVSELYRQRDTLGVPATVEVVIDGGDGTIGEKRQRLLQAAKGHFVCFVDDDDWVAHDYLARILAAVTQSPDIDCATLTGVMTTAGGIPERFVHSLGHEWGSRNGIHYRSPNHLNVVRREKALAAGFPALDHAEDHAYSMKLKDLLKKEASTGEQPLYYYFFQPAKTSVEKVA